MRSLCCEGGNPLHIGKPRRESNDLMARSRQFNVEVGPHKDREPGC